MKHLLNLLAAVALPAYQRYINRAAYTEVIAQANPIKSAISTCLDVQADIKKCSSEADLGVKSPAATNAFKKLDIAADTGVITMTPNDYKGIKEADTCVMTPTIPANVTPVSITKWEYSGKCVDLGYVKN